MTEQQTSGTETRRHADPGERFLAWTRANQRPLVIGAVVIFLVVAGAWFVREYRVRTAIAAQSALDAARASVQAENYPLAASDLRRLIDTYAGTAAAEEAVILLGTVRLRQGQPEIAAQELRAAIARGISQEFRAAAYGLMGVALEDAESPAEAAEAYRQASTAATYDFLRAQYLLDAARASLVAGDTASAQQLYNQVLTDYPEVPGSTEAQVRLGELSSGL